MFPIEKYKFYVGKRADGTPYKVIAVSSFAGQPVRGVAVCNPRDEFDLEKGKALAAARCNFKVAQKRYRRAMEKLYDASLARISAGEKYLNMANYSIDAEEAMNNAKRDLRSLELGL